MLVSIIVLNYNGKDCLDNCIKSLTKLNFPKDKYEIIVVDNNSPDESWKIVKKFRKVKLIRSMENTGFAGGNNIGVKHAKGKYIALINNDAEADSEWLNQLLKPLEKDKSVAASTGIVYYGKKLKKFLLPWFSGAKIYPLHFVKHNYLGEYSGYSDYPCGCSMMIKKDILKEIGGLFDEKFFMYAEDADLGIRLKEQNYKIVYNPHAIAYHHIDKDRLSKNEVYYSFRNRSYLMYKHTRLPKVLFLLLDFFVYYPIFTLYKAIRLKKIKYHIKDIIKARFDFYRML
ncbi:MAG: glycosyltransferase family 2 protein [Candidatus Pacearchaeota archaeon]|nr:glycosyltransferase family 2 protein [Candidatus Pacearchaeota archaeon]